MVDQYFGHNQIPGGGLYILENAFSENPTLRNVLENSVVVNGPWKGQKLEGGNLHLPRFKLLRHQDRICLHRCQAQ